MNRAAGRGLGVHPLELLSANVAEVAEHDLRTLNNDQQRLH
ncbi:MAG: hypothetical protein ACRBM6_31100 [Geminicoccales bacterium]